jgi:hypothetical protein
MAQGQLKRETNPVSGTVSGFLPQHESTTPDEFVVTGENNPHPVKIKEGQVGITNFPENQSVTDAQVKSELELVKAELQAVKTALQGTISTQVTGSNLELAGYEKATDSIKNKIINRPEVKIVEDISKRKKEVVEIVEHTPETLGGKSNFIVYEVPNLVFLKNIEFKVFNDMKDSDGADLSWVIRIKDAETDTQFFYSEWDGTKWVRIYNQITIPHDSISVHLLTTQYPWLKNVTSIRLECETENKSVPTTGTFKIWASGEVM